MASVFFLTEISLKLPVKKISSRDALRRICRCHLFVKDMLAQSQEIAVFVKNELAQKIKIYYNVQVGGAHYEIKKENVP